MLNFERDQGSERLPVTVVGGARGSGKTTLINHLLAQPGPRWAVIVNEMGEQTVTNGLCELISGEMVPHAVGCLCCVARSGLVDSLRRFYAQRSTGAIDFDRVLIETADDADPAPVLQTLLNNALVTQYYRLDANVVLVDAARALRTGRHAYKQIAMADRIVINRTDLVDGQTLAAVEHGIACLNTSAPTLRASNGRVAPDSLLGAGLFDALQRPETFEAWLTAPGPASNSAANAISSYFVSLDEPVDWQAFHDWLHTGVQTNGDIMYRVRGVVHVRGLPGPVVLHGVQQVFHPPLLLEHWPSTDRRTRLYFVVDGLEPEVVQESLARDLPYFALRAAERLQRRERARLDPSLPV